MNELDKAHQDNANAYSQEAYRRPVRSNSFLTMINDELERIFAARNQQAQVEQPGQRIGVCRGT